MEKHKELCRFSTLAIVRNVFSKDVHFPPCFRRTRSRADHLRLRRDWVRPQYGCQCHVSTCDK